MDCLGDLICSKRQTHQIRCHWISKRIRRIQKHKNIQELSNIDCSNKNPKKHDTSLGLITYIYMIHINSTSRMTIDKSCSVILAQTLAFVCFGSITNLVPNRDIQTQHANPPFLMQGAPSSRRAFNQPSQK